jgi:hypothetical protein
VQLDGEALSWNAAESSYFRFPDPGERRSLLDMTANFSFEIVRQLLCEIQIMIDVSYDNMKRVEALGSNDPRVVNDPRLPKAISQSIDGVNHATQISEKLFAGLKCDHIDNAAKMLDYWAKQEPRHWSELNTRARALEAPSR